MKTNLLQALIQSRFLRAALLGVLGALAFPPFNFWPVLFVIFIPMLRMAAGEETAGRAFRLGFVFAFFFFFCTLHWLIPTMQTFGPLPLPAAFGALGLLAMYLAMYPAIFFTLTRRFHLGKAPLILLVPASWVGLELLRSFLFTGFPWAQLGYGLVSVPILIQTVDLCGVYLLSFGIMAVNTAFAFFPAKKSGVAFACVFWILSMGYGFYQIGEMEKKAGEAKTLSVSILQGSIPPREKWVPAFQNRALAIYKKLVAESPESENRLFLWPETALPFFLFHAQTATEEVLDSIKKSQNHHLVGSLAYAADNKSLLNASYLISPAGKVLGAYNKSHLVPFGEFVPLRKQFPFLVDITGLRTEFSKGNAVPALSFNNITIGPLICFESVFPEYSRKAIAHGAKILSVQTNDAWFGTSGGPEQHLVFSQFRAVEFRRSVIRSANTGISAIILPTGKILEKTAMNIACTLDGEVALFDGKTLYARTGNLFAWLSLLASASAFLYYYKFGRKSPE